MLRDLEENGIVAVLFAAEASSIVVVEFAGKESRIVVVAAAVAVEEGSFCDRNKVLGSVLRVRRSIDVDSASRGGREGRDVACSSVTSLCPVSRILGIESH